MEYLEGETLQAVLTREGPMPWTRALAVGAQVARSLREAHKLGLVHRDLKPANVMLLAEGTGGDVVKVLDFGLVKAFASDLMQKSDTELTQAGVLLGSPLYMAPEQARGDTDQRTDIYSLGVLLFQCLAGRPPFQGKDAIDIIVKHVKERPPELKSLRSDVPNEVNDLVMKCLEKTPTTRYQSMDELLEAMRVAVSGQGISGLFIDPRTFSNPLSPSASQSTRPPSSARVRIVSPSVLDPSATRSGRVIEVPSVEVEITESGTHPGGRSKLPLIVGVAALVVLGVAVGGALAWRSANKEIVSEPVGTPKDPVKPPVELVVTPDTPPPPAVEVVFDVDSDPQGATVTLGGSVVGTTPFSFSVSRTDGAPARAELAFTLDGFKPTTMLAQGSTGHVPVKPTLTARKATTPKLNVKPKNPKNPKNPNNDTGYKDDPYQ